MIVRALGFVPLVVSLIAACGSDDENLGSTQTGGAGGNGAAGSGAAGSGATGSGATGGIAGSGGADGGLGGTSGAQSGGFGGIPLSDAGPPLFDGPDLADAGWFDCGGCACNGATHYCLEVAGGAKVPGAPPPPDAALCDGTGTFGCTPLPANCVDAPSCSCIPVQFGGACQCSDDGGGLLVFCALP